MAAQRKKYVVFKANIMDDDGNVVKHDQVVELTAKTAKHYNSLGFLRPYMEEDVAEDGELETPEDDDPDSELPTFTPAGRTRRTPPSTA